MNAILKGLFYLKTRNLVTDILNFLLPETKNNEKNLNKISKNLEDVKKIFEKIKWENKQKLEYLLLLAYEAKSYYLKQDYVKSKKIAFEIRKQIINDDSGLTEAGKNLLIFSAELIEIKCSIDEWALSADEEYNKFYNEYFSLTEKTLKVREKVLEIKNKESEEYISLNRDYMLGIITLNELSNKKTKGLVVPEEKKKEGEILLNKLTYFEEKIIKYKNNTLNFNYNILLEKIKIGFYIGVEVDKNFKLMSDFCYLCVNNYIEDPIYSALESFRKNEKKNYSFKDYLYSFKLEIFKSEDKRVLFKLQKIENFVAKEEERIKVNYVKRLEDAKTK